MISKISLTILFILLTVCYAEVENIGLRPIYTGPKYVKEGSAFGIKCLTDKFQNPQWTKTNAESDEDLGQASQTIPGETNLTVYFETDNATVEHAGIYTCHKFSQTFHEIIILNDILTYADTSSSTDGAYVIILHKKLELFCNVTTTPGDSEPLGIEWFLDDVKVEVDPVGERISFKNNSLNIKFARESDLGVYTCKANEIDFNNTITVYSKPFVHPLFSGPSINKIEDGDLTLNCTVEGLPRATIIWLKDGLEINEGNDSRYHIQGNQSESILKIDKLDEDDRANYSCLAKSSVGESSASVFIRVKDKLAALWPFLGIVAEVAVLCTIIFIYEKRRAKQEFDESDTDQSPDTKNVSENKDVRQRK